MKLKIFQLNIEKGRFLKDVIIFVNKNNFDILHLQEVSGGIHTYNNIDCYKELQNSLPDYSGELSIAHKLINDSDSYMGNATFVKKPLIILEKEDVRSKKQILISVDESKKWAEVPRTALILKIKSPNSAFLYSINAHFPWSPTPIDTEHKTLLGKKIIDKINTLSAPFILTGDFNSTSDTQLIKMFDQIGKNLTTENHITNTLNPHTHREQQLFPPGLAVDFIFTGKSLPVAGFKVINSPDLSDHYGLVAIINIEK